MQHAVFEVHSTLEAPLSAVMDYTESVSAEDLPPEIESIETSRRGNTLIVDCEPVEAVGRYTPTAAIKGSIDTVRVLCEDDGTPTTERYSGPTVTLDENGQEMEVQTVAVEYVQFKGSDAVLINSALREPMFEVLCMLADATGVRGQVQGVVARDGELTPVRVTPEGEVAVELNVVDDPSIDTARRNTKQVDWAENPYI